LIARACAKGGAGAEWGIRGPASDSDRGFGGTKSPD
jgi:hypothetical protein